MLRRTIGGERAAWQVGQPPPSERIFFQLSVLSRKETPYPMLLTSLEHGHRTGGGGEISMADASVVRTIYISQYPKALTSNVGYELH